VGWGGGEEKEEEKGEEGEEDQDWEGPSPEKTYLV